MPPRSWSLTATSAGPPRCWRRRARAEKVVRPLLDAGAIPWSPATSAPTAPALPPPWAAARRLLRRHYGRLLGADEVWVWTDVDGITRRPQDREARLHLDELTYVEAAQLATSGAGVLHPKTVKPLVERGIPLRIRNTFNPEHPGTLIVGQASRANSGPRAIITSKGLSAIAVIGNTDGWSAAVSARALGGLVRSGRRSAHVQPVTVDKTITLLVRGRTPSTPWPPSNGSFRKR